MAQARNLADLLRIRHANRSTLRKRLGYRGSAVGFKFKETEWQWSRQEGRLVPAVILFVDEKSNRLPDEERIEAELHFPPGDATGLSCATDVVQGRFSDSVPWVPTIPLSQDPERLQLWQGKPIAGGVAIRSPFHTGTAACVVRRETGDRELALLTNAHVAGQAGIPIERPEPHVIPIGQTISSLLIDKPSSAQPRSGIDVWMESACWADCALVGLDPSAASQVKPGVLGLPPLSYPRTWGLNSMDPVGQLVVSVGATCGRQHGRIMGIAYEWRQGNENFHADYLILGCEPGHTDQFGRAPFAAEGDSGKLVLLDEGTEPVALLWGGHRLQFNVIDSQQAWCLATDIHRVLDRLQIRLLDGPFSGSPAQVAF